MPRFHLQEVLNFIATEPHKGFGALFTPVITDEARAQTKAALTGRLSHLENLLDGKTWLMGEHFTIADAYLFVACRWCQFMNIELSNLPNITAWMERVAARQAVKAALDVEAAVKL